MEFVSLHATKQFAELLADKGIHDALCEKAMLGLSFCLTIAALLADNADLDIHYVLRAKAMLALSFCLTLAELLADNADLDNHDVLRAFAKVMLDLRAALTQKSKFHAQHPSEVQLQSDACQVPPQTHNKF